METTVLLTSSYSRRYPVIFEPLSLGACNVKGKPYCLAQCFRPLAAASGSTSGRLRTFHCNTRELLLRTMSRGGAGASGGALCVVKLAASEGGPCTEPQDAQTLRAGGPSTARARQLVSGDQGRARQRTSCDNCLLPDVVTCGWSQVFQRERGLPTPMRGHNRRILCS